MKRVLPFVIFVSFVSFVFPGCEAPPARAEGTRQAMTAWRTLGAWSGDGSRQTESFDVTTGALRLRWEARGTGPAGREARFRVWLYSAISGRPLQLIVDQSGTGNGVAHLADDPRVSYLVIESTAASWTASLEEAVATAGAP